MKNFFKVFLTIVIFSVAFWFIQKLIMPKYMNDTNEGAMTAEYYDTVKNHDVIFFGDCQVYETYSPCILWDHYGISSYVRGSSQQEIWQSYYLLEETLKYEKPSVVVVSVFSLSRGKPGSEAYNRLLLDGMKMSTTKINCIQASMTEGENIWEYIFPLLRFHDRWKELSSEDIEYLFSKDRVAYGGYMPFVGIKPLDNLPVKKPLADYTFSEYAMGYLDKIRELCNDNGITLILVKDASVYPYWYDEWEQQVTNYASTYNIPYYNLASVSETIGIDYSTDTYDGGMHMNTDGAEKCSDYIGSILVGEFNIPDHRSDEKFVEVWNSLTEQYYDKIAEMKQ